MNIILLSGGSGKRLWPLSNDVRSKQFIKIFKGENGIYESMVQKIHRQIKSVDENARVIVATSKSQVSILHNQLGDNVSISIEPYRRDTFPAIALATAYLHDMKHIDESEAVVVCPVDPYVKRDYFEAIKKLWYNAQEGNANLSLMGIEPTHPSEKYGYIIPKTKANISKVSTFKEKPDVDTALEYIAKGALWNGGVFAYKIGYVLHIAKKLLGTSDYEELFSKYETVSKISFDYAVAENEKDIDVIRFNGQWKDLGTWDTLCEAIDEKCVGSNIISNQCKNTHVINELTLPVICCGVDNTIISVNQDGILVANKDLSNSIKPLVDKLNPEIRFLEKSWGECKVLDVAEKMMTVKITIKPMQHMSYHSHELRNEVWTIMSGTGKTFVDGMEQRIKPGDVITISPGCRHTIMADDNLLELLEVRLGSEISSSDEQKYELELKNV